MTASDGDTSERSVLVRAGGWCLMQGCSSVSLMILNKYLATYFDFPILTLIVQNFVATVLSIIVWYIGVGPSMKPWKTEHFVKILPMGALFTILLYTSFRTIGLVSISTVVIFRNAGPLFTAVGENYLRNEQFSNYSLVSLSMMIVGAFCYGFNDLQFDLTGYMWAAFNLCCNTAAGLFGKHLSMDLKSEQSGLGLSCYQNIVSLPMFIVVSFCTGEAARWSSITFDHVPTMVYIAAFSSCLACVTMGVSTFELQRCVSQATVSVANVSYKLITLIIGAMIFGNNVGVLGLVGLIIAQGSAILYVWERNFSKGKAGDFDTKGDNIPLIQQESKEEV